jgi:gamma-glutamyltranspeptidase/glutathione hydrolase
MLAAWPTTAAAFLKDDGSAYRVGETLRLPALAATLAEVAEGGRGAFYEGPIARRIATYLTAHGGVLTGDDLAAHRSDWVDPLRGSYRGLTVLTPPPNSQGFATLEILGILEHFDVAALAAEPARYVDLVVRATRAAFGDRDRYLTDPAFSPVPLDRLLGAEHLAELSRSLWRSAAIPPSRSPGLAGDTTFSCAVDCDGNVAAVIQSLYFEWGSGVVAGDTGILLQNRGTSFSLDPSHPNRLEPGKRTFHTLTAALLLGKEGNPRLVLGTMGGEGQPQTQAAVVTRMIDHDMPVQMAIDAPRWLYGRTWGVEQHGLRLERGFGEAIIGELEVLGHQAVGVVEEFSDLMGHAQAICILPERLEAASDPRADGVAVGY